MRYFFLSIAPIIGEFCETLGRPEKVAQKQNGDRVLHGTHGKPENERKPLSKRSHRNLKPGLKSATENPVSEEGRVQKRAVQRRRGMGRARRAPVRMGVWKRKEIDDPRDRSDTGEDPTNLRSISYLN
ncbi:hypothetical protein NDU88_006229 [Pleurodeles waltl]|uniref:Uncharacterized protein n=1 Tax=Pleurodeles waltl TaxID=8319 RepID=A0AAV7TF05_PLEWA|nr:hypothetical protein NDU88_006229 [Pleurodeles waltl]